MPLSSDCVSNPFRVRKELAEHFPYLLHAVMALSSQHLSRKKGCPVLAEEMHSHWSSAIQMFREALGNSNQHALLDTLLILVNIEVWSCSPHGV